jgi:hypothetical protein
VFWYRVERGKEQLQALQAEIDTFCGSVRQGETFYVACEKDSGSAGYVHKLLVPELPNYLRWTVLVGEIVQNLRVPLDQIAYALVKSTGAIPTIKTSFPVFKKRDHYDGTDPKFAGERSGSRKVRDMESGAQAVIESLQPYNGTRMAEGLLILDRLWRTDKHLIPLAASSLAEFRIGSGVTWGEGDPGLEIDSSFPFEHERNIGRSARPMEVHVQIAVEMRLRESGPWDGKSVGAALTVAGEAAFDAIGQLEPFVKWSAM